MKKLLIFVMISVLSLSIFFCGCNKEIKEDDKLMGSSPTSYSKKTDKILPANFLSFVIDKEFPLGQDVEIELSFGTRITKSYIDTNPEDNVAEPYKIIISAIGLEGENAILEVNNFYAENYPFPGNKITPVTTKTTLPQSLFVGDKGNIWIGFHFLDENTGVVFYYKIEENMVYLSNQKF